MTKVTAGIAMGLALSAASCASLAASERFEPGPRAILLPAGEGDHVLFDAGRIVKTKGGEEEWSEPANSAEEQPSAAGFDLDAGWACVGYSDRLAFVQLGGKRIRWCDPPGPGPHRSIAVRGELVAVNSGREVSVLEVPSGERVEGFDAGRWLKQFAQDEVDYAEPVSDTDLVLITSRDVGALTDGRVLAIRTQRAPNGWLLAGENHLRALTWADQCVSKGDDLFVAGVWEETRLRSGRAPELFQSLVVLALDVETLQVRELVRAEHATPTIVVGVAVGVDELAVLLAPGEVRVYSLAQGSLLRRQVFPRADSVAWIGAGRWLVRAGDSSTLLTH